MRPPCIQPDTTHRIYRIHTQQEGRPPEQIEPDRVQRRCVTPTGPRSSCPWRVTIPFAQHLSLLQTIPGIGERAAQVIISEIGVNMSRFPTAAHLASWAGLCPGNKRIGRQTQIRPDSQRQRRDPTSRRSSTILVEAAWSAGRTSTYLGARFRRLHRRFGNNRGGKATVAIAHRRTCMPTCHQPRG
jgi:transposase